MKTDTMTDAFICYALEDTPFRDKVIQALTLHGITTWTHDKDIGERKDFGLAIKQGIEQANNILFFISPDSVISEYCIKEINHALKNGKQIIPLLVIPTDSSTFPKGIEMLPLVDFTNIAKDSAFDGNIDEIVRKMNSDKT